MTKVLSKALAAKISALFAALLLSVIVAIPASASSSVGYDFDTLGQLDSGFNKYISSGSVAQSTSGGISNSGAINAPGSANAVFASKAGYSMGPVGSSYTFQALMQSVGNSGYSGMGFTTYTPSATNASTSPVYRPSDAIGISVHGGGFVFHNGSTNVSGNWGSNNGGGITNVKLATISDLLNSGSADKWYEIVLVITRASTSTLSMHVEVWPTTSAGVRLNSTASAIFELNNQTNTTLINSPTIFSYINFSGDRVRYFDGYSVDLAGGASVIEAGAPVVLTSSSTETQNKITVGGNVTSENGSTVTERGFVYGTTTEPTTSSGTKVVVGSGLGTYSGTTSTLSGGTYYVRAYATNSTGTTYGSENTLTLANIVSPQTVTWSPTKTTATTNASSITPDLAAVPSGTGAITYAVVDAGSTGCAVDSASPPVITFSSTGECVVRATASSNASFTAGSVDVTFVVTEPQSQTVTWLPTNTETLASASALTPNVGASTSGTGEITYAVQSDGGTGCVVNASSGALTFSSAGSCVVRATAASDDTYAAAWTDVTFTIGSTTTSLTLNLDVAVGDPVENAPINYETTGLQPGADWDLVVRSSPRTIANGKVGASGGLLGSTVIPSGLEPGWHSITLSGTRLNGGLVSTTVWFKVSGSGELLAAQTTEPMVTSAQSDTPARMLSATGISQAANQSLAALLLACGLVLVIVRRIHVR